MANQCKAMKIRCSVMSCTIISSVKNIVVAFLSIHSVQQITANLTDCDYFIGSTFLYTLYKNVPCLKGIVELPRLKNLKLPFKLTENVSYCNCKLHSSQVSTRKNSCLLH